MIEIIYVLLGLNVLQLVFWSFQVQKLIDKIIAKNLQEYRRAKTAREPELKVKITDDDQDKVSLGDFRI